MEEDLRVNEHIVIPGYELWVTTSRSSGAGGQHVNTTESRVSLHWCVASTGALERALRDRVILKLSSRLDGDGTLAVHVEDHRSQHRNRGIARERLVALVRDALRTPRKRIATRPTRASKRRRLEEKRHRAAVKRSRGTPSEGDG